MVWFDLDIGSRNEQKWYSSAHVPFSGALLSTYMVEVANYIRAPGSRSLYSTGILEVDRRKLSLVENARDSGGYGKHWGNALSQAKLLTSFAKHCDGGLMRQLIHPIFFDLRTPFDIFRPAVERLSVVLSVTSTWPTCAKAMKKRCLAVKLGGKPGSMRSPPLVNMASW